MGEHVEHPEHPPDDATDVVHLLTERITRHRDHEHDLPEEQHHDEHAEQHLHGLRDWLHLTV